MKDSPYVLSLPMILPHQIVRMHQHFYVSVLGVQYPEDGAEVGRCCV